MIQPPFDVVSVADLFADVVVVGREHPRFGQMEVLADTYEIEVGGSAPIFAAQFAKLGGRPCLVGRVGRDPLGQLVRLRLLAAGVDLSYVRSFPGQPTPLGLNLSVGGDRAMLTVLGCLNALGPDELPPLERLARHVHIAGYFLLDQLHDYFLRSATQWRAAGLTISLDTNWAPAGNWERVHELLPLVDVFLPNENEAKAISGSDDTNDAGILLSMRTPLVVVKKGAAGAAAFSTGGVTSANIPPELVRRYPLVDTTGAGDSFDAGFVHAWLKRRALAECLEQAILCGTASTSALGGLAAQYTIRR